MSLSRIDSISISFFVLLEQHMQPFLKTKTLLCLRFGGVVLFLWWNDLERERERERERVQVGELVNRFSYLHTLVICDQSKFHQIRWRVPEFDTYALLIAGCGWTRLSYQPQGNQLSTSQEFAPFSQILTTGDALSFVGSVCLGNTSRYTQWRLRLWRW